MVINILVFILFITRIHSEIYCNLKLSKNKLSSIKGGDLIYDMGTINPKWISTNTHDLAITDIFHSFEYLYVTEIHENSSIPHERISVTINSNNTALSNPKLEVEPEGLTSNLEITTIKIDYNCHDNIKGVAEISMTIKSDQCEAFTIKWLKVCKPFSHRPHINLGFTPTGEELMKAGIEQESFRVFKPNEENHFMVSSEIDRLPFYMSYSKPKSFVLKEPELIYDNNVLNAVITGPLSKGGIISNSPSHFNVEFGCLSLQHSISMFEIILRFENNDVVYLFLRKECNNVGNLTYKFSFFKTVYNMFVIIVVLFAGGVCFYYYKRNRILIREMINKLIDRIQDRYGKRNKADSDRLNYYVSSREASYDENDLVDVKIKTDKDPFYKKSELNSINTKYDSI